MTLEIQVLAWDRNKNVAGLYFQDFLSKIDKTAVLPLLG
jgi:hypothetical protein